LSSAFDVEDLYSERAFSPVKIGHDSEITSPHSFVAVCLSTNPFDSISCIDQPSALAVSLFIVIFSFVFVVESAGFEVPFGLVYPAISEGRIIMDLYGRPVTVDKAPADGEDVNIF
jgi:hypothetical protein